MDFITLDSAFQPKATIDNYSSLIWTERYDTNGDFQLETTDVGPMSSLLPLESFVSLRDSSVPMIVEAHQINKDSGEAPKLTVTGRSFETVLERRLSINQVLGSAKKSWFIPASKQSDAAYLAARTVLGDFPQYQLSKMILPLCDPSVSPSDAIHELRLILPADYQTVAWSSTVNYVVGDIVGSGTSIYQAILPGLNKTPASEPTYWTVISTGWAGSWGTANYYEITADYLYTTIINLITVNYRGLKSVRPDALTSTVGIEIYNGANRTSSVAFDARFDQFDSSTYLLSKQGSTNVAYTFGASKSLQVLKNEGADEPLGLQRRLLYLDASGDVAADVNELTGLKSRGLVELYNNNVTALFDGEIGEQVAVGYNSLYFLGDIIQLIGDYGLYENVRVTEYIRSADSSGEKAYPTFEAIE